MRGWLWRRVEAQLRREVPQDRVGPVLVELAEDYAARRSQTGPIPAAWWLLRESRSLLVEYRRERRQPWMRTLVEAGRDAYRSRARRPWSLAASAGMLALAVGIATAMFTLVDALVLRPAPFKDAHQLAQLVMARDRIGMLSVPSAVFNAWRSSPAFSAVEAAEYFSARVGDDPLELERSAARVTPGVFAMLGNVRPLLGRLFEPADAAPGRGDVVLLSETLWRSEFQADPATIGRSLLVGGRPATVVGILPSEFRFPEWNTVVWQVSRFDGAHGPSPASRIPAYVRFAPGVPRADALQLATAAARAADPRMVEQTARDRPLSDVSLDKQFGRAVPLLSAGVALLFLVLCANVSSLQLAALSARGREIAVRAALGASRTRLVWQAFFESALAGLIGIAIGAGLAGALVAAAEAWLLEPLRLRSLHAVGLDARALAVTSLAGFIATLAAGVVPAVIGTRVDAGRALGATSRGGTDARQARMATRALLVCQIALSCTLLFGAALLVRSFVNLAWADRGFDTRGIIVASIQVSTPTLTTAEARVLATQAMQEAARAMPGISAATWSYGMPPAGAATMTGEWSSDAAASPKIVMDVYQFRVSPEFFSFHGIPVLRGRAFQRDDPPTSVLVSERLARLLWPGEDPVGRRMAFNSRSGPEVIGVVKDIRYPSLDDTLDAPQYYMPFTEVTTMAALSLRCEGACPDAEATRRQLAAAAPGAMVYNVRPLEAAYAREFARPRAASGLALAFAITALVAAAAGLFSLLTHNIARRRREFGIRTALGASPSDVRRLVWRDGAGVMLAGVAIGTLACVWIGPLLSSLLFNVSAMDPLSWGLVVGALAAGMTMASWHPARSAVRATPTRLLRED